MESKKQLGKIGIDFETGMYWGKVLHLCATETYHAESVDELRQLLRESVPERQEGPSQTAVPPTDPFLESLVIDLDPALITKLNQQARLCGLTLNEFIVDILEEIVDRSQFPKPV